MEQSLSSPSNPSSALLTAGARFRQAVQEERPLQVVGTINAYSAMLAKHSGFRAIYLSGAGVANACFGLPDLAMTTATEVSEEIRRITAACDLPLLVDADTGWGNAFSIGRTVKQFTAAGAAGMHLEDQQNAKRCGHRPNKQLVTSEEMCDRIKAAVDSRTDESFVVMARTDAIAGEGLASALARAQAYIDAGADMIFAEALPDLEGCHKFTESCSVPVLANITEFGKTPMWTTSQLADVGIRLALYPLSAFRAMNAAALEVFGAIRSQGTQESQLAKMQTREELYQHLGYHQYEAKLDKLFSENRA